MPVALIISETLNQNSNNYNCFLMNIDIYTNQHNLEGPIQDHAYFFNGFSHCCLELHLTLPSIISTF